MFKHQGIWLPDGETHLTHWMDTAGEIMGDGRGSYQIKKFRAAIAFCKQFRTAVDIGAHCGLWSIPLENRFDHVEAFEPVAAHRECYLANLEYSERASSNGAIPGFNLHACALGDHEGMIKITTEPTSSGDSRVDGDGDIPMHTLDSFQLHDVDFIKIDTEGFELYVIKGAEETIKRCRPVMVVEQKGHGMKYFGFGKEEGVELLQSWGMRPLRPHMSGDWIMGW